MDQSTRILIDKIGIALSMILGALAVVWEFLGWWDAAGIVLAVFSLILGVVSVLDINGSQILALVAKGMGPEGWVRRNHEALLENQKAVLGNQEAMLENQRSMIEEQGSIGSTLDRIEQILDERLPGAD